MGSFIWSFCRNDGIQWLFGNFKSPSTPNLPVVALIKRRKFFLLVRPKSLWSILGRFKSAKSVSIRFPLLQKCLTIASSQLFCVDIRSGSIFVEFCGIWIPNWSSKKIYMKVRLMKRNGNQWGMKSWIAILRTLTSNFRIFRENNLQNCFYNGYGGCEFLNFEFFFEIILI